MHVVTFMQLNFSPFHYQSLKKKVYCRMDPEIQDLSTLHFKPGTPRTPLTETQRGSHRWRQTLKASLEMTLESQTWQHITLSHLSHRQVSFLAQKHEMQMNDAPNVRWLENVSMWTLARCPNVCPAPFQSIAYGKLSAQEDIFAI